MIPQCKLVRWHLLGFVIVKNKLTAGARLDNFRNDFQKSQVAFVKSKKVKSPSQVAFVRLQLFFGSETTRLTARGFT